MLFSADDAPTIVHAFAARIGRDPEVLALLRKEQGTYRQITWRHVARDVWSLAGLLKGAGIGPKDRVIHVSENRYEWIVGDLAIQFARAIHVPVHAPLTGPQIAWQIHDSGAKVVILS